MLFRSEIAKEKEEKEQADRERRKQEAMEQTMAEFSDGESDFSAFEE